MTLDTPIKATAQIETGLVTIQVKVVRPDFLESEETLPKWLGDAILDAEGGDVQVVFEVADFDPEDPSEGVWVEVKHADGRPIGSSWGDRHDDSEAYAMLGDLMLFLPKYKYDKAVVALRKALRVREAAADAWDAKAAVYEEYEYRCRSRAMSRYGESPY